MLLVNNFLYLLFKFFHSHVTRTLTNNVVAILSDLYIILEDFGRSDMHLVTFLKRLSNIGFWYDRSHLERKTFFDVLIYIIIYLYIGKYFSLSNQTPKNILHVKSTYCQEVLTVGANFVHPSWIVEKKNNQSMSKTI